MPTKTALAAGALLLLALAGCGTSEAASNRQATQPANDPSAPVGIMAQGIGHITGVPDVVTITIGTVSTAAHAAEALAANSAKANVVTAALKSHGVADADIQTSELSLYPQYDNGNVIRSYGASDTVTAKLRDVRKAGGTIDAAVTAAGDAGRLQGVSFSFGDNSSLLARARSDAVGAARAQAQQLADAAGVKLGALRSLSEDASQPSVGPYASAGLAHAAATPIQAGSQELTVRVTAVWNLA